MTDGPLGTPINRGPWAFAQKKTLQGQHMRLEPLCMDHLGSLWSAAQAAPDSFTYLRYGPFQTEQALADLIADLGTRADQPFWAVIIPDGTAYDAKVQGEKALGWLSICDVSQTDGAFEIGSIWFAPALQGSKAGREAIFRLMCLGMDDLGYERLVWRCQAQNQRSFHAALKLGFTHEGTWRNAAIIDGWQRDIAWFSILRAEWPDRRAILHGTLYPKS